MAISVPVNSKGKEDIELFNLHARDSDIKCKEMHRYSLIANTKVHE